MALHRYWRLYCGDNVANGTWSLGSLEFRATAGGADLTGSGTASVSGSWNAGTNPPANLYDHNAATWWACNAEIGWAAYDFGAAVEVLQIAATCRPDDHTQPPTSGTIDVSDDNVNWTRYHSFGPLSWAANGTTNLIAVPSTADPRQTTISKTNLAVTSKPVAGIFLAKTNIAVNSKPLGGPIISKTNMAVQSQIPPVLLPPRRRTLLIP